MAEAKAHVVRKRSRWDRARAKKTRPKTPAPKSGWVLAELSRLTNLRPTTVRYYVAKRLIRPSEFRGTVTRYQRRELIRLLSIRRIQSLERTVTLKQIAQRFDELGDAGLEAWLSKQALAPHMRVVLGLPAEPAPPSAETALTAGLPSGAVEVWRRVALLPGLDLMVRADASPVALSAAQRICVEFLGRSSD